MTNQRKIYGAVLTLALSAFGIDRFWSGPDQGAAPKEQPPSAPAAALQPSPQAGREGAGRKGARGAAQASAGPGAPGASGAPASPGRSLAARLLEVAQAQAVAPDPADGDVVVPDAFKPSSLWSPAPPAAAAATVAVARPAVPPERLEEVRTRHKLTAVMRSTRGGMALIGGKVYAAGQTIRAPGQAIDGFTVDSVGERSAVLRFGDATVELKIDPPDTLSSLSGG